MLNSRANWRHKGRTSLNYCPLLTEALNLGSIIFTKLNKT